MRASHPRDRVAGPAGPGRAAALALGLVAVAAYAAGAWLSATLSPTARRPILDGNPIPQPYHWVSPPPSLAKGNQPPDSGRFSVAFDRGRLEAGVFSTNDQQASVVLSLGAIARKDSARSVRLSVQPVDPASVATPPGGLSVLGNAYRVDAAYDPGDDPVTAFTKRPLVVLVYPALITHGLRRAMMFSEDGKSWSRLKTTDDPTSFQASSTVSRLNGYFAVVTRGGVSPVPTPGGGGSGGSSPVPWIVIGVAAGVAVALGIAGMRARAHHREYESYRGRSGVRSGKGAGSAKGSSRHAAARRRTSSGRRPPKRRR